MFNEILLSKSPFLRSSRAGITKEDVPTNWPNSLAAAEDEAGCCF